MMTLDDWLDYHCPRRDEPLDRLLWAYNLDSAIERQSPDGVTRCLEELDAQGALPGLDWEHVLHQAIEAAGNDREGQPLAPGTPPPTTAVAVYATLLRQPDLDAHLIWHELERKPFPTALLAPTAAALAHHRDPLDHRKIQEGLMRLLTDAPAALEAMLDGWQSRFPEHRLRVGDVMRAAIRLGHEGVAQRLWTWAQQKEDMSWHQGTRTRALAKNMPQLYLTLVDGVLDLANPAIQQDLWLDVVVNMNPTAMTAILPRLERGEWVLRDLKSTPSDNLWAALDQVMAQPEDALEPWRQFLEAHGTPDQIPNLVHWRDVRRREAELAQRPPAVPRHSTRRRA